MPYASDVAQETVDDTYGEFGRAAVYTAPGGQPEPCVVIVDLRDLSRARSALRFGCRISPHRFIPAFSISMRSLRRIYARRGTPCCDSCQRSTASIANCE
jgi:hypothetical protein